MKPLVLACAALVIPLRAELPADAALLQAQHTARIVELNQKYANELEKLQKRAMQSGNLEAANEIEKEIARVIPNPLAPNATGGATKVAGEATSPEIARILGTWKRDTDGGIWEFKDDGSGSAGGGKFSYTYSAADKKYTVVGSNWINKVSFGLDADILNGEWSKSGKTNFKLKRVK